MKLITKIIPALVALGLVGLAPTAMSSVVMVKIAGLYCNSCIAGARNQIKKLEGVSRIETYFKDQMIAVYPTGDVSKIPYSEIKAIIKKSTYQLKGIWVCKAPTLQLSTCKKVG